MNDNVYDDLTNDNTYSFQIKTRLDGDNGSSVIKYDAKIAYDENK